MNAPDAPRPSRALGTAAAVAATTVWASAAVIGKAVDAPVTVMLAWRHLVAVVAIVVLALAGGHRFSRAGLRASAPAAVLFAAHTWLFFAAVRHASVAIVVIIYALAPVLVIPLANRRFGERPAPIVWVLALVSLGGVALVVGGATDGGGRSTFGLVLSVCNVLGWVAFTMASKQARERGVPTMTWLLVAHTGACICTFAASLATGASLLDVHGVDWVRIAALGLLPGLVGHAAMIWAYRSIDVSLASLIAVGEPVLSALGAAVFLDESLTARQLAGIMIVCAAIALVALRAARPSVPRARAPRSGGSAVVAPTRSRPSRTPRRP